MNRTMILIVVLTGATGLTIGWWASGSRTDPVATQSHEARKPPSAEPVVSTLPSGPGRLEFPLGPRDIANDRETPALAVNAEGRAVLAWAAQSGDNERTIHLARSSNGGKTFDPPVPFRKVPIYRFTSQGKKKAMAYSTHVLPRLAAGRDGIDLGWVEAIDGGPSVGYFVARSRDGGRTFSEPVRVHGGDASRPGFTTLSADPDGGVSAAWLDGRDQGQQPFASSRPAGSETFEPERLVYAGPEEKGVCPCCDLAALRTPDGRQVVAFRNSDAGHRDIWLTRSRGDGAPGFETPVPVTPDAWSFDGCPHDGPSLALGRDGIHVLWMDAHTGKGRVYAARSPLSSWSFAPRPVSPDAIGAQGHPKLAASGGSLFVVWDEALDDAAPAADSKSDGAHHHGPILTGGGRAVMLAISTDDGAHFQPARPIAPRPGAFQLNPALAVAADGAVLVAWNELDSEGKRVVFARVKSHDVTPQPDRGGR